MLIPVPTRTPCDNAQLTNDKQLMGEFPKLAVSLADFASREN
jgi:hypothetical protein